MKHYDFGGYATRFNVKCTDGRTIRKSAFDEQLPTRVPLVWQHQHDNMMNCIGHADLESRPDGVYAYCSFTTGDDISPAVKHAKALVKHGDIDSMSIYANHLVERGKDVMHGVIKEVSLVLAGANPGAKIQELDISHSDDDTYGAVIYAGREAEFEEDILIHEDSDLNDTDNQNEPNKTQNKKEDSKMSDTRTIEDIIDTMDDDQQAVVAYLLEQQEKKLSGGSFKHADEETPAPKKASGGNGDMTVGEVLETLNDDQKAAVMYIMEELKKQLGGKGTTAKEEETDMKHNAFETYGYAADQGYDRGLSHSDEQVIWKNFMSGRYKSFKDAVLDYASNSGAIAHADTVDISSGTATYGIDDIEWLFPDAKVMSNEPIIIDRRQDWVKSFMNGTTHLPVSRVKSIYADVTADDARAKGYAKKAQLKVPEVIKIMKHVTHPTTVLKMQKFDKDDLRDITNFDPLKWIDGEMTGKMHEELARAALIGDGREDTDPHKIDEDCIVPILKAHDLFTIKSKVNVAATATDAEIATAMMDQSIRAKKDYRGSGSTTLYTTEDMLAEMLLLKDLNGRRIFENEGAICSYMRCSSIETVEFMEGLTRKGSDNVTRQVLGIIVNPKDYAFGSDSGSAIETFKQFDIDYNQEKILKETRCSGALRVPYSAIVLEKNVTA